MTQNLWQRDEADSPCVRLCTVHPETRLCLGCKRTLDEIAAWSQMSREDRLRIMATLDAREAKPAGRRGGRAARRGW